MKIQIIDKFWKIADLQLIATTKVVKELIIEYKKDPNCRAYDWIYSEKITDIEKAAFIYFINNFKQS